jgi:hypothetical protein
MVSENGGLKGIFGPKKVQITESNEKGYNEDSVYYILSVIKSWKK